MVEYAALSQFCSQRFKIIYQGFNTSYQFTETPWVAIFIQLEEHGWICYPIPLLLGCQNTGDPSCANSAVVMSVSLLCSMLDALPNKIFRALATFSNEMRASSSIMAFTHANQPFVALFVIFHLAPTVENAWFSALKMFYPLENCCFWRSGWRACLSQLTENFSHGLSGNDAHLDVGPKVVGGENQVFCHFLGQCLLHGSKRKMLWNKHLCSFSCEFLQISMSDFALFDDVICSFACEVFKCI